MLTWKTLLPAVIVPTAVCLTAQASLSGAAEECRTRPGLSTPRDSHWYYRIDRPDRRHCWFLAAEGRAVRVHGRGAEAAASGPDASKPKAPTPNAELQRPSAAAAPVHATPSQVALMGLGPSDVAGSIPAVREIGAVAEFAARWPSPLDARYSDRTETGTTDSMDTRLHTTAAAAETTVNLPVVTAERGGPEGQRASRQEVLQTASLAGGAALALLFFAGWIVKAGGRSHVHRAGQIARAEDVLPPSGRVPTATVTRPRPGRRQSMPTDPAVDLKTSLAELMGDLRRADAADAVRQPAPLPRLPSTLGCGGLATSARCGREPAVPRTQRRCAPETS